VVNLEKINRLATLAKKISRFQEKRMRVFEKTFHISPGTRILNVGGYWTYCKYLTVFPHSRRRRAGHVIPRQAP
jgi:hypothetical protein